MPDYAERATFEALVNHLIHRDYTIYGSEVHIDIYDDRLVISSPGGMYDGTLIQERDIDRVASCRRNPIIADVFAQLDYMEKRGCSAFFAFVSVPDFLTYLLQSITPFIFVFLFCLFCDKVNT